MCVTLRILWQHQPSSVIRYSFFVMIVIVIGAIPIDKLLRYILMRQAQVLLALEMLATHDGLKT